MSGKNRKKRRAKPDTVAGKPGALISRSFAQALKAQDRGDAAAAEKAYQQCLKLDPAYFPALYNLALLYHDSRQLEEAEAHYRAALKIQPQHPQLHKNLADLRFARQQPESAIKHYHLALAANPREASTWFNLGLAESVNNNLEKAQLALQQALSIKPGYRAARAELGEIYSRQKNYDAAIEIFEQLLREGPDDLRVSESLAECYWSCANTAAARPLVGRILAAEPKNFAALNLMIMIHMQDGQHQSARALFPELLTHPELNPRVHSNLLYNQLMFTTEPAAYLSQAGSWWQWHGAPEAAAAAISLQRHLDAERCLQVGLLSPDFRRHSVSHFILPWLRHHDSGKLRLILYADSRKTDDVSEKIAALADHWRMVGGLSHDQLCRQIIADKLDVLIELSGHTANNRLPLMARRPAPVIISWLGYPASTGLEIESFRLGDCLVDPPENADHYTEELLYPPPPFLCYEAPAEVATLAPKPPPSPAARNPIVFGSFNNPAKLSDSCLALWAEILHRAPASRLLLKARPFQDQETAASLIKRFAAHGIGSARLRLDPGRPQPAAHFSVYYELDIALDPLPYNGTTTTFEALWMGIPVVVLEGESHAARVGAGIMRVLGCEELIATSPTHYVAIALALAAAPEKRATYHLKLRERLLASALMDGPGFARGLEKTLREVWRKWRSRRLTMLRQAADCGALELGLPPALSEMLESNDKARDLLENTLLSQPSGREVLLAAAGRLHDAGASATAAMALREILSFDPDHFAGRFLLARILSATSKKAEAICHFQRLLQARPEAATVTVALNQLRLEIEPENPEWHFNLAGAYYHLHQPDKARAALEKTLQLKPDEARAWSNLGLLEQSYGSQKQAAAAFARARRLDPYLTEAAANLMWLLAQDCDWRGIDAIISESGRPPASYFNPLLHLALSNQPGENLAAAKRKSGECRCRPAEQTEPAPSAKMKKILTIGYLSGDFRDHAVAHNLVNLFQLHDRRQFKVNAYSFGPDDQSYYRRRIAGDADHFVDLRQMSDPEAARLIQADGVDILIELMGHTRDNRLGICALKPAPIQISWLGYPGTTGADFIDYLIADRIVIPPDEQQFFSEKVLYLENCYMIADRADIGPSPTRSDQGLPAREFVFCSFNSAYKIEEVMFTVWMEILRAVPASILWLRYGNEVMARNLRREAETRGVAPERLVFAGKVAAKADHLARLQLADLALDTRIYNGHTTSLDALWAGVPLLALKGQHFPSRVSTSNLKAVGLPEMVCDSLDDYRQKAITLAQIPERLAALRQKLAANRLTYPLFDTKATVRNLEKVYGEICS